MPSKAQTEARVHNWNKAQMVCVSGILTRSLRDVRLLDGQRHLILEAVKLIDKVVNTWE